MKNIFISFLLLLMLSSTSQLLAAPGTNNSPAISKQQAMGIAQQANPGRVLAIKQSNGVYRVKILNTNGEVRIIQVDINNGNLINR